MKICLECQRCYDDGVEQCEQMHGKLAAGRAGSLSIIEGYRIDVRLDSGVRGELFRATRTDCGRGCLIRLVMAEEETANRFLEEAKIVADLFHPDLTAVYDWGRTDSGELFVVSEDASDGDTLRKMLEVSGTPPLLDSIRIVRGIAETLHELHTAGGIFRALNPENILIRPDDVRLTNVRLQNIDLGGVAQEAIISNRFLIDNETSAIRYFSPEQCSDKAATARSDVYSLGILLYELIAGAPPFNADRASGVIEQHRHVRPPELTIDNFDLRMLISHTLMESLNKRPELRQASADLFARQLRHIELLATHVSTPPPVVSVAASQPSGTPPRKVSLAEIGQQVVSTGPSFENAARLNDLGDTPPLADHPTADPKPAKIDPDNITPIDFRAVREQMDQNLASASSVVETSPEPKAVEWAGPLDDIPSVAETLAVLRAESSEEVFGFAEATEPDSLTEDKVPDVEVEYAGGPDDAVSLRLETPTLLGNSHSAGPAYSELDDYLFTSVERFSNVPFQRLRRGIVIGAVAGLFVLAITFRGEIAEAFTPFDLGQLHPSQSRQTEMLPPSKTEQLDTVHIPTKSEEVFHAAPALVDDPPAAVPVKASSLETKRVSIPQRREVIERPTDQRSASARLKKPEPQPVKPSTVVITYPDPRSRKADNDRDPFVAPRPATGLTRPRIVANPDD